MDEAADLYRNKPLGQILKLMELLNEGHIQEALQIQRKQGGLLGEILVALGYASRDEILLALAVQKGVDPEPGEGAPELRS